MNWTGFVGGTITAVAGVYAESYSEIIRQIGPFVQRKITLFFLLTRFLSEKCAKSNGVQVPESKIRIGGSKSD